MEDIQQEILNSDVIYALTRNLPNPQLISDVSLNNSDKLLTVPANQIWEILFIWIDFISTATVGNRSIRTLLQDSSSVLMIDFRTGILQAASESRQYLFAPLLSRDTAFFNVSFLHFPIPRIFLPKNFSIRILDQNAIDSAADDMSTKIMINRYDVP